MVYADDIREAILKTAEECGEHKTFGAADIARKLDQQNWQSIILQVDLVADVLIREGKILLSARGDGLLSYKKR